MRHIIEQLVQSGASLGLGGSHRFYIEDRRLQRNLERVMANPVLVSAALTGVIADHRVIEKMMLVDERARNIIVQVESKLGRRLGRERCQKLVAAYANVQAARNRRQAVVRNAFESQVSAVHIN